MLSTVVLKKVILQWLLAQVSKMILNVFMYRKWNFLLAQMYKKTHIIINIYSYIYVIHRSVAYQNLSEICISMLVYLEITIEFNLYQKYQHLKSDEFMHLLLWSSLVWLHNEVQFYKLFPLKFSCKILVIHYKVCCSNVSSSYELFGNCQGNVL